MVISAVDKFSRPLKKLQSGLSKIGSLAAGIGKGLGKVALGITAAVGAVSLVVARYTTMLDKIGKTSEKLGIDPLFLQKLRFAAEQTGVKVTALDMGLQRFIRRTAEAARGTGEAKQALADLGIELFNNDGSLRNVESVLFDVADAIANTSDSAEQVRLAFKFFDSEGVALVATLKEGSAGLKGFFQEAENLGMLISRDTIKQTEAFADATNRIKKQFDALVAGIMGAFLPALESVSGRFSEFLAGARDTEGTFDSLGVVIRDKLVEAFANLIETIGTVGKAIIDFSNESKQSLAALAMPLAILQRDFYKAQLLFESMNEEIEESDFDKRMEELADSVRNFTWEGSRTKDVVDEITNEMDKLGNSFMNLIKFGEGFGRVFNDARDALSDFDKLGENVAKTLENGLTDAFMNIKNGAEGLKDTMDQILKLIVEELIRVFIVQKMVSAVGSFFGFPGRASGGPVTAGRTYLVGEKGPELFTPGSSGGITPNNKLAAIGGYGDTNINITYDIKAFDAKDATAAIAEQAPTIVGIVEQSFRKRGKRGPLGA